MEQVDDSSFVEDVCFLPNERSFILVEWSLEVLLVLSDQQLPDVLQLAFALGDGVNLDALDEDLDDWSRLWEFCPRQRKTVE